MIYRIFLTIIIFLFYSGCIDNSSEKLRINKLETDSICTLVQKCIDENNFQIGENIFNSFSNIDSTDYEYFRIGGDIKLMVNKPNEAIKLYIRALSIKKTEDVYKKLAEVFSINNSPENYIICIDELIKLDPKNPNYYYYYGEHFYKSGIYSIAIDNVSKSIWLSIDKRELYLIRADYRFKYGDTIGAISDCDSAISFDKTFCKAYLSKATLCANSAKGKLVIETTNKALKINCDKAPFLYRRGCGKFLTNDLLGAREDIIRAVELNDWEAKNFIKTLKDVRFKALFPLKYR